MAGVAGEWELCGDRFYERAELYRPAWGGLDVEDMRIIPAPYSGPVAFIRDDRKIVRLRPGEGVHPVVRVFTAAGAGVAAFEWEGGRLAGGGWTVREDLVLVSASAGAATLYDPWGGAPPRSVALGDAAAREGLVAADCWGDGLVAVTGGGRVIAVTGLGAGGDLTSPSPPPPPPRVQHLATCLSGAAGVGALAALPPAPDGSCPVAAVIAVGADLVLATPTSARARATAPAPVTRLAASPCGAFVAAFTTDGRLLVWASDFSAALSEFATQADGPPAAMAWCGADAVLLLWPCGLALLVGPYGDWVKYDAPGAAGLAPEPDGVRLLGAHTHDLVRRVPDALADAFRPGSTAPAAALADARRALDAGDPAAHARLRDLSRAELAAAAAGAAAGAVAAVKPRSQGDLLKAGALGLAFALGGGGDDEGGGGGGGGGGLVAATRAAAASLADAAALLRVLRCAADPAVGWPLTGGQAGLLGPAALVGRLARRGHHLLALRAADALGVAPAAAGPVATHWAVATLASPAAAALPDADLAARLRDRCDSVGGGVRWGDLAAAAAAAGRPALASHLLDAEPDPAARVPLLLELGDGGRALEAAVRAADPGLIALVVDRVLPSARPDGSVPGPPGCPPWSLADKARRSRAVRAALVSAGCGASPGAPEAFLARFLGAADASAVGAVSRLGAAAAASHASVSARAAGDARAAASACADAAAAYDRAADLFRQAGAPHWAVAAADGARLRRLQASLEGSTGHTVLAGLPAAATVAACARVGDAGAAARVKADMHVPDRLIAWGRARAAAASGDWAVLDTLAGKVLPADGLASLAKAAGAPDGVVGGLVGRMVDGGSAGTRAEVLAALGVRGGGDVGAGGGGGGEGGGAAAMAAARAAARGLFRSGR